MPTKEIALDVPGYRNLSAFFCRLAQRVYFYLWSPSKHAFFQDPWRIGLTWNASRCATRIALAYEASPRQTEHLHFFANQLALQCGGRFLRKSWALEFLCCHARPNTTPEETTKILSEILGPEEYGAMW